MAEITYRVCIEAPYYAKDNDGNEAKYYTVIFLKDAHLNENDNIIVFRSELIDAVNEIKTDVCFTEDNKQSLIDHLRDNFSYYPETDMYVINKKYCNIEYNDGSRNYYAGYLIWRHLATVKEISFIDTPRYFRTYGYANGKYYNKIYETDDFNKDNEIGLKGCVVGTNDVVYLPINTRLFVVDKKYKTATEDEIIQAINREIR